jgi:hypothetical protein
MTRHLFDVQRTAAEVAQIYTAIKSRTPSAGAEFMPKGNHTNFQTGISK